MKKEKFFKELSKLDDDLIERAETAKKAKPQPLLIRIAAAAACLALILAAFMLFPTMTEGEPPIVPPPASSDKNDPPAVTPPDSSVSDDPISGIVPDFDFTVAPDELNGSALEFVLGNSMDTEGFLSPEPPAFKFKTWNVIVKAKVVENYPDTYCHLDANSTYPPPKYRLILMQTLEVIQVGEGSEMPEYFLYLMPEYYFVDMTAYDSLIISMVQEGAENYVIKNVTRNRIEVLPLFPFRDYSYEPVLGNMIAFTDGIFDESLWESTNWRYGYQWGKHYLDDPDEAAYPLMVRRGGTEAEAIENIKIEIGQSKGVYSNIASLNFQSEAAREALEYVKPFENGVFEQSIAPNDGITFRRFINGCQTEETVTIRFETEEVVYSDVRYTAEDIKNLVNVAAGVADKAKEYTEVLPVPPHTDPNGKKLMCLNVFGWYAKVDGKIYGIIKTAWRYENPDDMYVQYYDDLYLLYDPDQQAYRTIDRDSLVELVGGYRNIYHGKYNEEISVPMC